MNKTRSKHTTRLREQVISSMFWTAVMQYSGQIVSWLITLWVIRLLNPEDYGLMAKTMICVGFMLMVGELGLTIAVIQKKDIQKEEIEKVFGFVIVAAIIMAFALYAFSPALARFFGDSRLVPVYRFMCPVFIVLATYLVPQALMIRNMDFRAKSIIDMQAAVAGSICTLGMAVYGMGVWSLVAGFMAGQVVSSLGYNISRRHEFLKPRFDFRGLGKLFSFGGYVSGTRLLWYIYSNADMFIGSRFLSSREMGIFAVAAGLASLPLDKFTPIITQVALPAFSLIQDEAERVRNHFLKSIRLLSLVIFPVCWGCIPLIPEIMKLFGSQWKDATVPIQVLCIIIPLRALGSMLAPALQGIGKPGVHFVNLLIISFVLIPAFLIGVRRGISGLCFAWVIGYTVAFIVTGWLSVRAIGVKIRDALAAVAVPMFSTSAMLGCIYYLKLNIGIESEIAIVTAIVLTGAVVYCSIIRLVRRDLIDEFVFLFKNRQGRRIVFADKSS